MSVIDTSMNMPKSCDICPYCNGENATCDKGILIPWRAFDVENYRNTNCPLKSTDEMIAEIEGYARFHKDKVHNDVERGKYLAYEKSLEITHRCCDTENIKSEG